MKNEHERSSSAQQHPFFHTMVLMGSALAIGCGGLSNDADASGGRSGAGGTGGTGGSGGTGSTGGTSGAGGSTGGVAGTGGIIIAIPNGGRMTVDPGPFVCTPAQWECDNDSPACYGDSYALPDRCGCDETRPLSIEDCESGQVFACRMAHYNAMGTALTQVVPFECSCVAEQLDCGLVCDALYGYERGSCTQDDAKSVLCGCAVIVLR